MKRLLKRSKILNATFDGFFCGDLLMDGDRIAGIGSFADRDADEVTDLDGAYVMPGFVDIHTHGSLGVNYSVPGDFSKALLYSAKEGVTSVLPTVGLRSVEDLHTAIAHILDEASKAHHGASIDGIHLEGPFISAEKKGAMKSTVVPCDVATFDELVSAAKGMLRVMTIAPERENAIDVIKRGAELGIRMSVGHTAADENITLEAIKAGATGATHTFNAMTGLGHRAPMAVGALLTEPGVVCEAICDMFHLSPITVKLIRAAKGIDGMILISDSGFQAGLPDGDYEVDGLIRYIRDGVSRNAAGTIAGSTKTMGYDAKKLREIGFTLPEIAKIGAHNPAKAVGLYGEIGSISIGKRADIVICDDGYNIIEVFARGVKI